MSGFYSWLAVGLILSLSELWVPGFVIIFFGAGALLTSVATLLFPSITANMQLFLFVVLSVVSLIVFRRHAVGNGTRRNADAAQDYDDDFTGHEAVVVEPVAPGRPGKVELNGVNWNATAGTDLAAGDRVKVLSRDGLTLKVQGI